MTNQPAHKHSKKKKRAALYQTLWKWHFYAGLIFAPFLLILAVTGAVYLFKPQFETFLYSDYYQVTESGEKVSAAEQVQAAEAEYPSAVTTAFRPGESPTRSSEVKLQNGGDSLTVFVNPYSGETMGSLNDEDRIMDKIEEIHGELMAGTTGDRIVELAASWAVVLIGTGLYLWLPNRKKGPGGVWFPRLNKGKKIFRRDLHAVPAFWISAGMLFLIMTGLPWSGFWGTNFQNMATNTGEGYPPSIWTGSAPTSDIETKDIAEVPWAAETLDVPASDIQGLTPVSINDVVQKAEQLDVHSSYSVYYPDTPEGVYTLSAFPPRAQDEATVHIDQYTGAVLANYQFDDYGWLGKTVALGITLHKGTQFGLFNQLLSLLICLGIILVVVSGFYLWLKKNPGHGIGAPKEMDNKSSKPFFVLLIVLGLLFPLAGMSLLIAFLIDLWIIRRVAPLRRFFHEA